MNMKELKNKMYNSLPVELIKNIMIYNAMKTFYGIIIRRTFNNFKYNKIFNPDEKGKVCFICENKFTYLTGYNTERSYVCEYYKGYYKRYDRPLCNKCNTLCEFRDNINKKDEYKKIYGELLFVNKKYLYPVNVYEYFSVYYNPYEDYSYVKTNLIKCGFILDEDYNEDEITIKSLTEDLVSRSIEDTVYTRIIYLDSMPKWIINRYIETYEYLDDFIKEYNKMWEEINEELHPNLYYDG